MKRAIFSVLTAVVLAGLTGCITQHGRRPWDCMGGSCAQAPENCQSCNGSGQSCVDPNQNGDDPGQADPCRACGGRGCRLCRDRCRDKTCYVDSGPPAATITYPYYTIRGPRDFLAKNPPSIGP